jgi:hypothetical protein
MVFVLLIESKGKIQTILWNFQIRNVRQMRCVIHWALSSPFKNTTFKSLCPLSVPAQQLAQGINNLPLLSNLGHNQHTQDTEI